VGLHILWLWAHTHSTWSPAGDTEAPHSMVIQHQGWTQRAQHDNWEGGKLCLYRTKLYLKKSITHISVSKKKRNDGIHRPNPPIPYWVILLRIDATTTSLGGKLLILYRLCACFAPLSMRFYKNKITGCRW
jgi:hypothetical protein